MRRLLLSLGLVAALATPALAWDPASAGRYGGQDLDSLDVGGKTLARGGLAIAPACASTAGATAANGTMAWEPSCRGVFAAPGQDIVVYPTRGTNRKSDGSPDQYMFTNLLIQSRGDGGVKKETNGLFINHETVGGSVSAASLDTTNSTGALISVRQRPGPNGEKPPTTWGLNVDHVIENGAGGAQSYNVELDLNNYNRDCKPGFPCLSAALYLNGIGSYANTAWIYSGGGTTDVRAITVTASGNTVTRVSGQVFRPSVYRLTIGGTAYRVTYVDADHVTGVTPIPDIGSATAATWTNPMVANGVLFQGDNMASDNDLALNTAAYAAVRAAGRHHVAFDTSLDEARYSLIASAGQQVCLNGFGACFVHRNGRPVLEENGGRSLEITSAGTNTNGLQIQTGGDANSGPILSPTTTGGTNVRSTSRARGLPPCRSSAPWRCRACRPPAGPCAGTLCVDSNNAVYVKTTSGACL